MCTAYHTMDCATVHGSYIHRRINFVIWHICEMTIDKSTKRSLRTSYYNEMPPLPGYLWQALSSATNNLSSYERNWPITGYHSSRNNTRYEITLWLLQVAVWHADLLGGLIREHRLLTRYLSMNNIARAMTNKSYTRNNRHQNTVRLGNVKAKLDLD